MKKYLPFIITGAITLYIAKNGMGLSSGVNTIITRPEKQDESSWWQFW